MNKIYNIFWGQKLGHTSSLESEFHPTPSKGFLSRLTRVNPVKCILWSSLHNYTDFLASKQKPAQMVKNLFIWPLGSSSTTIDWSLLLSCAEGTSLKGLSQILKT